MVCEVLRDQPVMPGPPTPGLCRWAWRRGRGAGVAAIMVLTWTLLNDTSTFS